MFGKKTDVTKEKMEELEKSVIQAHKERIEVVDGLQKQVEDLTEKVRVAKSDLKDMEDKQRRHDEELKHQLKLKEERIQLEADRRQMEQDKKYQQDVADLHEKYRDKTEEQLKESYTELRGMYKEVLERLPNINTKLQVKG